MKRRTFLGILAALPFGRKLVETTPRLKYSSEPTYIYGNIRGIRADSCIVDEYYEISPELYEEVIRGFAHV